MEEFGTEPIVDLKIINGISFPRWLDKRKLIITGPPGTGKTTILNSIGGWPEEGYLDISTRDWWKSPALVHRPREIHFGLPFVGFENAVPVYDTDSLDDSSFLELDLFRIPLPPLKTRPFSADFRGKFVFEFVLLPPEKTFELRKIRARAGTHHVDEKLTLTKVREEATFYWELALYFQHSGLSVYIRDDLNGNPKRIVNEIVSVSDRKREGGEELFHHFDQIKLRQRLLNRSWSIRGNKELLDLFVEMVPKVLNAERCSIFINDPVRDRVWLQCGTGVGEKEIEMNKNDSVVGQVISTGEYVVKENMDRLDGPHKQVDAKTGFVTRNQLCVPIMSLSSRKPAGAILLLNKKGKGYFEEQDRAFLEKVASHLEAAIESIFLRQEMMDFSELLTHRARYSEWTKYLLWTLFLVIWVQAVIIVYFWSAGGP